MNDLPDFIIVGAMKSATSSLQEQLERQPGIFMCTPKEPNFFSDDAKFVKGIDWYKSLFKEAPANNLLGEASTHYTKLPSYPNTINRINEIIPNAKFIYIMRHPVDRLVSHYIHEWSMGVFSCELDRAIDEYPELISYGQYAMQIKPYFECFGKNAVCPVFFDRLVCHPQTELERICRFIGYKDKPSWISELSPSNVSSDRIRRFYFYNLLVETSLATFLRRLLIPKSIREQVKRKLKMEVRPELSDDLRKELNSLFDEDLSILGSWLGVDLNCVNFRDCTKDSPLEWVDLK